MSIAPRLAMAVFGGLQGLALWALAEAWPDQRGLATLSVGAMTFVAAGGAVVHFARGDGPLASGRLWALAGGTGALFAAAAMWVGWQLPVGEVPYRGDQSRISSWIVCSPLALYVLLPFLQTAYTRGTLRIDYPDLCRVAWNNFFVASLGVVHTAALWIVLALWWNLFGLIGIDAFERLFTEPVFAAVASGASLGYGIAVARESERVVATLRGVTQALLRLLLPVALVATLGFVVALPFTGLELLFETQSAATILLSWVLVYTVLLNAVYLDGEGEPQFAKLWRRVIEVGVVAMPLLAGIAVYAIALRVDQYGLTVSRFRASIVAVVMGAYALGYAAAALRRGEHWMGWMRPVNVALAWVLVAIGLGLHTPLLDPISWSLRAQLARLEDGTTPPAEFDFAYLRKSLGGRGYAALEAMANDSGDRAVARLASEAMRDENAAPKLADLHLVRVPPSAWPPGLREAFDSHPTDWLAPCRDGASCVSFGIDLGGDARREELIVIQHDTQPPRIYAFAPVGTGDAQRWVAIGAMRPDGERLEKFIDSERILRIRAVPTPYADLDIDGHRFTLRESGRAWPPGPQ